MSLVIILFVNNFENNIMRMYKKMRTTVIDASKDIDRCERKCEGE